jgi:hypothetical protein
MRVVRSAIGDDLPPGRPRVVGNDAPATVDCHRQPGRTAWRPQPVPPSSSRRRPSRPPARASPLTGPRGCASRQPGSKQLGYDARRRPLVLVEALERAASPAASVCLRPVVRRGQPAVSRTPRAHRVDHALACPDARGRPRMAHLAIRVGVALAVARLRIRAAAAAHPPVARLDRPRLLAGRVVGA